MGIYYSYVSKGFVKPKKEKIKKVVQNKANKSVKVGALIKS